jgi:predicted ATPase with chaperone activity
VQLLARDGAAPLREKRISGALMDRFDIHIEVPRADHEKRTSDRLSGIPLT